MKLLFLFLNQILIFFCFIIGIFYKKEWMQILKIYLFIFIFFNLLFLILNKIFYKDG